MRYEGAGPVRFGCTIIDNVTRRASCADVAEKEEARAKYIKEHGEDPKAKVCPSSP